MKKILLSSFIACSSIVSSMAAGHIVTITTTSNVLCFGTCTGSVTASVSGGVGPFTYSWSSGGTSATETGICAGNDTVYCTDNSDMSVAIAIVTITQPSALTMPASTTTNVCSGGCAVLSASASGGSTPYTYLWNSSSFLSSSTIPTPTCCPPTSMSYTISVTDMNGCVANAIRTVVVGTPITSVTTSTNATDCATCDGDATVVPSGGAGVYAYVWTSVGHTTQTAVGLCAGSYPVEITDANGCTVTDSAIIFSANDVAANFTMVPDSTDPYNFFAFNSSTGPSMTYLWDFGDGTNSSLAAPSHTYAAPGVFNVCLVAYSFVCGSDTLCLPLTVSGTLSSCNALFNIADDTINTDPNAHYVYNLSYGAALTYLWDFGDGTTSTSATPSHVYSGTGPYLLCLSIDNGAGCTDMFCDSLISADSLNRSSGTMQFVVYDVPTFYSTATGISNAIEAGNVTVAPNPFNETTIFTVNTKEIYSFELTDVLGKKVKSKTGISEKQIEISRDGLENGIYFYKIYTAGSIIGIGKVIVK